MVATSEGTLCASKLTVLHHTGKTVSTLTSSRNTDCCRLHSLVTFASDRLCTRFRLVCVSSSHHEAAQVICESALAQRSVGLRRPPTLYSEASKPCSGEISSICVLFEAAERYCRTTTAIPVVAHGDYDAITSLTWFAFDRSQSCRRQCSGPGVARSQAPHNIGVNLCAVVVRNYRPLSTSVYTVEQTQPTKLVESDGIVVRKGVWRVEAGIAKIYFTIRLSRAVKYQ